MRTEMWHTRQIKRNYDETVSRLWLWFDEGFGAGVELGSGGSWKRWVLVTEEMKLFLTWKPSLRKEYEAEGAGQIGKDKQEQE